ncbi:MAG TPA: hypothetical protein VFU47_01985, partial [Armatimonadota bacterium]|nr:hypothetical protein [Armatimonadota bacterium]
MWALALVAAAPAALLAQAPGPRVDAARPAGDGNLATVGSLSVASADTGDLPALVRRALEANPDVRAALERRRAVRARIAPAGALPDPTLMAGIENLPLGREEMPPNSPEAHKPDPMTMKMVGVGQTIPYPGKLRLRRRAA